jgi:hypothetical protein
MTLTAEDLAAAELESHLETLEEAVTANLEGWSPNLAVVSEPYAGRSVLMDAVAELLGKAATRREFTTVVEDGLPDFSGETVCLVENCHYLYTREIGGFEVLDRFLQQLSASNALFVTSWNRYAWDYLSAVRDVDDVFATTVDVPSLSAEQMAALLSSNYAETMPEFVQTGDAGRVKTIDVGRREVSTPGGRTVSVPLPELNLEYLTSRSLSRDDDVDDIEAVVFQKIARLSNGNPGVATRLWEQSLRDGEIAPAYVEAEAGDLDVDDDESFVLEVLLAKGRMSRAKLAEVLTDIPVHRALLSLSEQGIVEIDEETASIDPVHLHAVDSHLRGRRLIW